MTPAALKALMDGDIENFVAASTPGGIEAQEARGQKSFVASETLPLEIRGITKQQLIELGFSFGDPVDNLFQQAALPTGWTKRATNHSMWSEIVDDKGAVRASIFYKAAFYDRSASMSWNQN